MPTKKKQSILTKKKPSLATMIAAKAADDVEHAIEGLLNGKSLTELSDDQLWETRKQADAAVRETEAEIQKATSELNTKLTGLTKVEAELLRRLGGASPKAEPPRRVGKRLTKEQVGQMRKGALGALQQSDEPMKLGEIHAAMGGDQVLDRKSLSLTVLKKLREDKLVKTKGEKAAMVYSLSAKGSKALFEE